MRNTALNIALLYGGTSEEREVSLLSAATIVLAIDPTKYNVTLIAIDPKGKWYLQPSSVIAQCTNHAPLSITTDPRNQVIVIPGEGLQVQGNILDIDLVFPLLHGKMGEDGALQGALEIAQIPYVGAGVCAGAVGMHKVLTKKIWQSGGLSVTPYEVISTYTKKFTKSIHHTVQDFARHHGWPLFIKPSRSGSSAGISKIKSIDAAQEAFYTAWQYDTCVLVEKGIEGREIEYAVIGNDAPVVSCACEVVSQHNFYDYSAKYIETSSSRVDIPANIPPELDAKLHSVVHRAYIMSEARGLARIDLLLDAHHNYYLNEINTMPGFTRMSVFPNAWKREGKQLSKVIEEIVAYATEHHPLHNSQNPVPR